MSQTQDSPQIKTEEGVTEQGWAYLLSLSQHDMLSICAAMPDPEAAYALLCGRLAQKSSLRTDNVSAALREAWQPLLQRRKRTDAVVPQGGYVYGSPRPLSEIVPEEDLGKWLKAEANENTPYGYLRSEKPLPENQAKHLTLLRAPTASALEMALKKTPYLKGA